MGILPRRWGSLCRWDGDQLLAPTVFVSELLEIGVSSQDLIQDLIEVRLLRSAWFLFLAS
jgi:hypothetical protein